MVEIPSLGMEEGPRSTYPLTQTWWVPRSDGTNLSLRSVRSVEGDGVGVFLSDSPSHSSTTPQRSKSSTNGILPLSVQCRHEVTSKLVKQRRCPLKALQKGSSRRRRSSSSYKHTDVPWPSSRDTRGPRDTVVLVLEAPQSVSLVSLL